MQVFLGNYHDNISSTDPAVLQVTGRGILNYIDV